MHPIILLLVILLYIASYISCALSPSGMDLCTSPIFDQNTCNMQSKGVEYCILTNSTHVAFKVTCSDVSLPGTERGGHCAFGFTTASGLDKMIGTYTLVGWHPDGVTTSVPARIQTYLLQDKYDPALNIISTQLQLCRQTASMDSGGHITIEFTRPKLQTIVPALSITGDDVGVAYSISLIPNNPTTTGVPLKAHSSSARAAGSVNLVTGTLTLDLTLEKYKAAHGSMMCIAWGLFLPIGIMIARFGKSWGPIWFHLHRIFNTIGLILVFIAWIFGLTVIGNNTQKTHRALGITIMTLTLFQPLNALIRPHAAKEGELPSNKRLLWNYLHHWSGRIAYILAIINIFIGFDIMQPGTEYLIAFTAIWCFVMFIGILLEAKVLFLDKPQGPTTRKQEMTVTQSP